MCRGTQDGRATVGERVAGTGVRKPGRAGRAAANLAAEGVAEVQVWLAPSNLAGINAFAPVLEQLACTG